jgi:hypothetical protein
LCFRKNSSSSDLTDFRVSRWTMKSSSFSSSSLNTEFNSRHDKKLFTKEEDCRYRLQCRTADHACFSTDDGHIPRQNLHTAPNHTRFLLSQNCCQAFSGIQSPSFFGYRSSVLKFTIYKQKKNFFSLSYLELGEFF